MVPNLRVSSRDLIILSDLKSLIDLSRSSIILPLSIIFNLQKSLLHQVLENVNKSVIFMLRTSPLEKWKFLLYIASMFLGRGLKY